MERIYAIQNASTKTAYVGRTSRALVDRWHEHLMAAENGESKTLYEYIRHDPEGFEITELEYSETASEAEWLTAYEADGWRMLNEVRANRAKPKKRDTEQERIWRSVNENARVGSNVMPNGQTVHEYIHEVMHRGCH